MISMPETTDADASMSSGIESRSSFPLRTMSLSRLDRELRSSSSHDVVAPVVFEHKGSG
jgi:hypothetical protein